MNYKNFSITIALCSLLFADLNIQGGIKRFIKIFCCNNISLEQAIVLKEYLLMFAEAQELQLKLYDKNSHISEDEAKTIKEKIVTLDYIKDEIFEACSNDNRKMLNAAYRRWESFDRQQRKILWDLLIKELKKKKVDSQAT